MGATEPVDGEFADSSAKARSWASRNRSPGFFSRQCWTIRCSAGEGAEPEAEISGGSSFRMAAMLSAVVSRLKACRPVSIS